MNNGECVICSAGQKLNEEGTANFATVVVINQINFTLKRNVMFVRKGRLVLRVRSHLMSVPGRNYV